MNEKKKEMKILSVSPFKAEHVPGAVGITASI
jgi:hypothetical protein